MQPAVDERGEKLRALRGLLAEKFPQPPVRPGGRFAVPLGGGAPPVELRRGAVTEAAGPAGSGALFLDALIAAAARERSLLALVDGAGAWDVEEGGASGRLLWVACREAGAALKAADLLLRDGNLPLVVLDLQMNPPAQLRRIPPATWYRFQRIVEPSATAFVVLTPRPMVASAAERLSFQTRWTLDALRLRRGALRPEVGRAVRREWGLEEKIVPMERRIA